VAKILVADDNSNIQKMVGLALKDQGIDVVAVGNGEAAVRKISDIRPDLVLADVFMPVRNGYEVCKYVKDDRTLCHIPVILLVGAFDPLDEQEAQRVGADGVLKKPFVPPDPLIAMVKSALARAGVPLGNEPAAAEKAPGAAARGAKETVVSPAASSKVAAVTELPEIDVEPVTGTFSTPGPASVKFAAGNEPLAFGSLLETPEAEEDITFTVRPSEALEAARHWGTRSDSDEVEEEDEEGSERGGWRPDGLDEPVEANGAPAKVKDWREEAFHGNSPANGAAGHKWTPVEAARVQEVADSPSVGVSTLENKPFGSPAPFAGDAWAAALATTVQEKIVGTSEEAAVVSAPMDASPAAAMPAPQGVEAAGPANWASVTDTPWELEAKKASLLAATWDTPAPSMPPSVTEAQQFLQEEPAGAPEAAIESVNEFVEQTAFHGASEFTEERHVEAAETPATAPVESSESKSLEASFELPALDFSAPETATESPYAASALAELNETQEVQAYAEPEASIVSTLETHAAAEEPAHVTEAVEEVVHHAEPAAATEVQQLDLDALVARVVAKMSPDVLQRVTQEILKPVIEALIKDELASKR
jgi:CheY-like chemotaxis protein